MKKLPPARRVLILLPRRAELKALGRVYKRTARNLRAIVDASLGDRFREKIRLYMGRGNRNDAV